MTVQAPAMDGSSRCTPGTCLYCDGRVAVVKAVALQTPLDCATIGNAQQSFWVVDAALPPALACVSHLRWSVSLTNLGAP